MLKASNIYATENLRIHKYSDSRDRWGVLNGLVGKYMELKDPRFESRLVECHLGQYDSIIFFAII